MDATKKQLLIEVVLAFAIMWILIFVMEGLQLTQTVAYAAIMK